MNYGYSDLPTRPPRRRFGVGLRASIALIIAGFVVCVVIVKFAVHEPTVDWNRPTSVSSADPSPSHQR